MSYAAYRSPENFPFGRKIKVLEAATLQGAMDALVLDKRANGFDLLSIEKDGEAAADAAFAKYGQIYLYTIEKE